MTTTTMIEGGGQLMSEDAGFFGKSAILATPSFLLQGCGRLRSRHGSTPSTRLPAGVSAER
eukprot:11626701-Alexandrium_andersonii.AAC.1